MRLPESYLSRIARRAWPDAIVTVEHTRTTTTELQTDYRLEHAGAETQPLGGNFRQSKETLLSVVQRALDERTIGT